jgi:hypothetical protein
MRIQALAGKCEALFRARISSNEVSKSEEFDEEKKILETQNARFVLWADNIGP